MEKQNLKFIVGGIIIVLAVVWLGMSGFEEGKAYYKTVDEIKSPIPLTKKSGDLAAYANIANGNQIRDPVFIKIS